MSRRRRAAWALAAGSVGCLVGAGVPAVAHGQSTFVLGTATATSQAMQIAPKTGGFAYTVTVGSSIADYRGSLAQAEVQSLDLGLIGTSLTSDQCDGSKPPVERSQLPQPLIAESDHGDQQRTADVQGVTQQGVLAAGGREMVAVTTAPTSAASFDGSTVAIPGVLTASGLSSTSGAALVKGRTRVATAEASVGSLSLLGGTVVLGDLHWQARQASGAEKTTSGEFTIGSAVVAGHVVSSGGQPAATVLSAVNKALAQTGVHLTLPSVRSTAGSVTVPPLSVGIDNSTLGGAVLNPVLTLAQPVTQQIEQALLGISCKTGNALTLEDIVLSALDGTGSLDIDFGGAQAGTDDSTYANPFGSVSLGTSSPVPLASAGGVAAAPPAVPPAAGTVPPALAAPQLAGQSRLARSCSTTSPAGWPSCSNGAALAAGVLGLVAVLGVGGADWIVTRRRRRLPTPDL